MKKIFYILAIAAVLVSCTEENLEEPATTNYSVKISREFLSPDEFTPLSDNVLVTLNVGNALYTEKTDSLLTARFKNIKPGNATVTIDYEGFSQVKYVVNIVDKESQNSTVSVIPCEGKYAATLSGYLTAAGKTVNQAINVIITPQDTIRNLVKHSGKGALSSVYVEGLTRKVVEVTNGTFTVTMPATSYGIHYNMVADDFLDNDTKAIHTYSGESITLYSGKKSVVEIKYK